ncbi:conserved exported protein of unknown function [Tenacibaculum sp. 190130A14a]|uniref:Uncharacterized protein n=1 Tax=Tenacibaculum polynesiense TaxID=3137857 RepID=A0ABP1F251_9FLAO
MKQLKTFFLVGLVIVLSSSSAFSQELEVTRSASSNINSLPEYIVITSENTKLLGGIDIIIEYKRSPYKKELENLEEILQDGDKLRVRNQTDLLNSMSKLGYEYIDAFNVSGDTSGFEAGKNDDVFASDTKYRINMVFRKKKEYRS